MECILTSVEIMKVLAQKNIKTTSLIVLFTNLFVLMIDLVNQLFFTRGENAAYEFIEAIFGEYEYCKKVMKKHLNNSTVCMLCPYMPRPFLSLLK